MMMSKRANELQQTWMEKYKLHQECAQLIEDNTKLVQRVKELESCSPQPHHDPKPLMQIPLQHEQQLHQQQRPQHQQQPQPDLQLKQGVNLTKTPITTTITTQTSPWNRSKGSRNTRCRCNLLSRFPGEKGQQNPCKKGRPFHD